MGLATAHELLQRKPGASVIVLEKESRLAAHQTGHNSGVIHSGIYYEPGSLKARICRIGIRKLTEFCAVNEISYDLCGKVIVAANEDERKRLHTLYERGRANGVSGLELLSPDALKNIEPHAEGVEALLSPETGIVDYRHVDPPLPDSFLTVPAGEEMANLVENLRLMSLRTVSAYSWGRLNRALDRIESGLVRAQGS